MQAVWEIQNLSVIRNNKGHVNVFEGGTFVIWVLEMQRGFDC
jgi:hypothetical protein